MLRNATLALTILFGWSLLALPQDGSRNITRAEFFKRADDELNRFIVAIEQIHHLKINFTSNEREKIITKYLDETEASPYFWTYLYQTINKHAPNYKNFNYGRYVTTLRMTPVVRQVETDDWGTLILSSEPSGADVFLKISSTRTPEGRTRIRRKYPEGNYTFVVELSGYKSKEISVVISEDNPVNEKIVLEKQ